MRCAVYPSSTGPYAVVHGVYYEVVGLNRSMQSTPHVHTDRSAHGGSPQSDLVESEASLQQPILNMYLGSRYLMSQDSQRPIIDIRRL